MVQRARPERAFLTEVGADPGRLRVGVIEEAPLGLSVDEACVTAVREAAAMLDKAGHRVEVVAYKVPDEFLAAFLNVVNSGLAGFDVDWDKTEPHVQASRAAAQAVDSLSYVESVYQLQLWSRSFVSRWGHDFDMLLTPTMSIEPPPAGEVLAATHQGAGNSATGVADGGVHFGVQHERPAGHLAPHPRRPQRAAHRGTGGGRAVGRGPPLAGLGATGTSASLGLPSAGPLACGL